MHRSLQNPYPLILIVILALAAGACSRHEVRDSAPAMDIDLSRISEPQPRWEPRSKYGNPETYSVNGKTYKVSTSAAGYRQKGIASWYGTKFHGRRTSSGEPYDMYQFSAAHKTLPLPTYARVTNLENGRSIIVKINDRGPFHDNRIIDLSYAAAMKLNIHETGTGLVEVEAITPGQAQTRVNKVPNSEKGVKVAVYLQVGAFSLTENARRLREELNQAGFSKVQIWPPRRQQEQNFYRVMLGPLESVEKTDKMAATLDELGYANVRVIVD